MGKYYTEKKLLHEITQEDLPGLLKVDFKWNVEEYKADLLIKLTVEERDHINLTVVDSMVDSYSELIKQKVEIIIVSYSGREKIILHR